MILLIFGRPQSGKTHLIKALRRNEIDIYFQDDATPDELEFRQQELLRAAGDGRLVLVCLEYKVNPQDMVDLISKWGELVQVQVIETHGFVPGFDKEIRIRQSKYK